MKELVFTMAAKEAVRFAENIIEPLQKEMYEYGHQDPQPSISQIQSKLMNMLKSNLNKGKELQKMAQELPYYEEMKAKSPAISDLIKDVKEITEDKVERVTRTYAYFLKTITQADEHFKDEEMQILIIRTMSLVLVLPQVFELVEELT